MGCLGTFMISLILLSIALLVLSMFLGGWSILIVAAAVIAAGITAYMELDKRVEAIEKQLGLHTENEPSLVEQPKADEENAP